VSDAEDFNRRYEERRSAWERTMHAVVSAARAEIDKPSAAGRRELRKALDNERQAFDAYASLVSAGPAADGT